MIEQDTVKLLRECDAGVKMGIESIDEVIGYVRESKLRKYLIDCKKEHETLSKEIDVMLAKCCDKGKEPSIIAKGMSSAKTNVKLVMSESDNSVADLMTDGCNMGVKSLSRYLNQYKGASEQSKDIAKKLIAIEEKLAVDIRDFL
jgi:hypothetical protein